MNKQVIIGVSIAIVVIVLGGLWYLWEQRFVEPPELPVTPENFEQCVAFGGVVMESYPRQCLYEGDVFVEVIAPQFEEYLNKLVYEQSDLFSLEDYEADCAARDGTFNDCGSPCGPDAEVCAQVCAYTCEL